jgi:hypothetical protein
MTQISIYSTSHLTPALSPNSELAERENRSPRMVAIGAAFCLRESAKSADENFTWRKNGVVISHE